MRAWIAFFLLLLFATQALPVAALGESYAKAQIALAEDIGEEDEESPIPKDKAKKQNTLSEEDYDHAHWHASSVGDGLLGRQKLLHQHDCLYALYSGEVTTPPPNCC